MRKVTSLLTLVCLVSSSLFAQVNIYSFSQSLGTYEPITGGTVHATGAWDDAMIPNIALGFTFTFNGNPYTQVTISPNGYVIFGGTTSLGYNPISSATAAPGCAAAVGRDLQGRTGSEIRSQTIGTPGNQIFVVQWLDAKRYGTSYDDEYLNFQIRLHEAGNKIEFVYGNFIGTSFASPIHPQVGMRGATNTDFLNRTTTSDWTNTTAGATNTAVCWITNTVVPPSGLSFMYTPPAANQPPSCANIVSPANGAINVPVEATLNWASGGGIATGYILYFGTDNPPTNIVNGQNLGLVLTYDPVPDLNYSTTYFWRIVPYNDFGQATDCPVWSFSTMADPTINTFPWLENFEGDFPPLGWSLVGGTQNWTKFTTTTPPNSSARANFWAWTVPNDAKMTTPPINLSPLTAPGFFFKWSHQYMSAYPNDQLDLKITTDNGATWTTIWSKTGADFNSNDGAGSTTPGSFVEEFIDLTPFKSNSTVKIQFHAISGYGPDCFVDDVRIQDVNFGNLSGIVTKANFGTPIANAKVTVGTQFAFTNASGFYEITNILTGSYTIKCEAPDYFTNTFTEYPIYPGNNTLDIIMDFAEFSVNPTSLSETLPMGGASQQQLIVSNPNGSAQLTWQASIAYLSETFRNNQAGNQQAAGNSTITPEQVDRVEHTAVSPVPSKVKNENPANWITNDPSRALLWDNGPFITHPGGGAGGANVSVLQTNLGLSTYGVNVNHASLPGTYYYIAEDFQVNAAWTLEKLRVFGYQTGSTTTSTFTGIYVQIWNGAPNAGGTVVWGDLTTNRMITTGWTNTYRTLDTDMNNTQRPIMFIEADLTGCSLTPGTYWIQWGLTGSLASGPWANPITILGQTTTGNALQATSAGWAAIVDGGTSTPQGIPFEIYGTSGAEWLTIDVNGGQLQPGQLQVINVTFNAAQLSEGEYFANINFTHDGQNLSDGTFTVPVQLTVSAPLPPEPPFNPDPADGATMVPLQPVFTWTNGLYATQAKIRIERIQFPFNTLVHETDFFAGNTFDLASVNKTLLPKTNYRWQIICKNSMGETSGPWWTFQTIGQGTIAGTVTDAYSGNPIGGVYIYAEILRNGYTTTTGPDGTFTIPNVDEGQYEVTATKQGYEPRSSQVTVVHGQTTTVNFQLPIILNPPVGLTAQVQNLNNVLLTWFAPGTGFAPQWLSYFTTYSGNSIGTGSAANFDVAIRFTPDQLSGFQGGGISKIRFIPGEPHTTCQYTLKIWQGPEGTNNPTLIYSQAVPTVVADQWNEVVLNTQVPVNISQELWIGFNCNTTGGYPAGCDTGPQVEGKGNKIFWNGQWYNLTELNAALTFNWGVEGYIQVLTDNITLTPVMEEPVQFTSLLNLTESPVKADPSLVNNQISNITDYRGLLGFKIYRNGNFLAYTTETSYTDLNLDPGTYAYTVTAVYDEGESSPAGPVTVGILLPPTLDYAVQVGAGISLGWTSNIPSGRAVTLPQTIEENTGNTIPPKSSSARKPYTNPDSPRQGGDDIATATVISSLPYTDIGTTEGYTDDYNVACPYTATGAPDVVYAFTPTTNTSINIDLCASEYDTKVYVFENTAGNSIACNDDACGSDGYKSKLDNVPLIAGNTYYIVVDGYSSTDYGTYNLVITENEPCTLECPQGSIPEGEVCPGDEYVDDFNGGCNSIPPVFSNIAPGDVICGTASTYTVGTSSLRDTDWYLFTISEPSLVSVTGTAEFPLRLFFIDMNNGCSQITIIATAFGEPCTEVTISNIQMLPGTYALWVGPDVFTGYPCAGGNNTYVVSLQVTPTFVRSFNVWRDGQLIASTFSNTYFDANIQQGQQYCYTVSEIVTPDFETGMSNEICVAIPFYGELVISPQSIEETHFNPPQVTTKYLNITNVGQGATTFDIDVNILTDQGRPSLLCKDNLYTTGCTYGDMLTSWQLANINVPNIPCSGTPPWYQDYTHLIHQLEQGGNYLLTVTAGYSSTYFDVWIDFNGDNVLTPDELVINDAVCAVANTAYTFPFNVPAGAQTGLFTMRARTNWLNPVTDPCATYTYGNAIDFSVQLGSPWLEVDPVTANLLPGESIQIELTFNSESLALGTHYANLNVSYDNPFQRVTMTVPVTLSVIQTSQQQVTLPAGWSGWSSYVDPVTDAPFASVVAPVVNDMIITQYFTQLFFPAFGINTMGDFSNEHGYISKMLNGSILSLTGMMADPTVNLVSGWNLIPVLATCNLPASQVFDQISGLIIAFEVAGNGIYYPAGQIYTLQTVVPGKAYWVKVSAPTSFTFPPCESGTTSSWISPLRPDNITSWNNVDYTGVSHIVVFNTQATQMLNQGDVLGAFTSDGLCAGMTIVEGNVASMAMFGDDMTTAAKDGFAEGEPLSFRLYRPGINQEYLLDVTFSTLAPNADGKYAANGLSVINDLTMIATGIGNTGMTGMRVYPNPSQGIFHLTVGGSQGEYQWEVSDSRGQVLFNGVFYNAATIDLSKYPKGIYMLKVTGNGLHRVEKLIVK